MPVNDQMPSTSRHCKKNLSPKISPWKKGGTTVNRFKKFVDDQSKRVVRRRVFIVNDDQTTIKRMTPKKNSPPKKFRKRLLNKTKGDLQKVKMKEIHSVSSTLEEGEIRSDFDSSVANTSTDTIKNVENDEDDCICIEPTLEEITIDDNDDDDFPSTSDVSTKYQSLVNSFKERESSTPFRNKISPASYAATIDNNVDKPEADTILPFFIDLDRGTEFINSTDNFTEYLKLRTTLTDKSQMKRSSVHLKPLDGHDKVIDLDNISNDNTDVTLKRKSGELDDDSVIFISETNQNDFIPIVDDNLRPHKILKRSDPEPKTPDNTLRTNNFFTHSETKKLNEYNENAYNPSFTKKLTAGKRMVIIDGSNVAFRHGLDQAFSVKGLQIAIEYFEKMGHEVKAVIPQYRMNKTKSTNPDELERLHKAGKIVQTPCKNLPGYTSTSYDDRFILQLAFATDAAVVSNDNYRDLLHENPAFKKIVESRVIGYTWCNDIFILPKDPYGRWGPSLATILNRR